MRIRKFFRELAICLLILIPLMSLLWLPVLKNAERMPWETGRPIPAEPPDEKHRVVHQNGISIIAPPNWDARRSDFGEIDLRPQQMFARRSSAGIGVRRHAEKPSDLASRSPAEFQGLPAFLKIERRPSTFDDPALTTWNFILPRNGNWFEASYFLADDPQEIPPMALRYLETLQIDVE